MRKQDSLPQQGKASPAEAGLIMFAKALGALVGEEMYRWLVAENTSEYPQASRHPGRYAFAGVAPAAQAS